MTFGLRPWDVNHALCARITFRRITIEIILETAVNAFSADI